MLFTDSFLSVKQASEGLYRDRGSRFLGFVYPVSSEIEIKEKLLALRKEHPAAVHQCYAWRLGAEKTHWRANDDGEPSGTAGKPILGQIQSHDLSNILIVVVRYFGGTLLGVPGLINAYRTAAQEALVNAETVEVFIQYEYQLHYDADDTSAVMRALKELDAKIVDNGYGERNYTSFQIKKQYLDQLEQKVKVLYKTKLELLREII
jgi:uncharacterized YigZ family protein